MVKLPAMKPLTAEQRHALATFGSALAALAASRLATKTPKLGPLALFVAGTLLAWHNTRRVPRVESVRNPATVALSAPLAASRRDPVTIDAVPV